MTVKTNVDHFDGKHQSNSFSCRDLLLLATMKTTVFIILSCMVVLSETCGRCTILAGCGWNEFCFRNKCVPRPHSGQACAPAWLILKDQCIDSWCKCEGKCSAAQILGGIGGALGGHPDMIDMHSCCRCTK